MFENSGSFQKLWVIDANYYDGIILRPNSITNILSLADDYNAIEIPFTLDTGTYSENSKNEHPGNVHTVSVNCKMPFKEENKVIIDNLPPKKLLIIKDYEGIYKVFGNINEPMPLEIKLDTPADFNKGKFYKLEFARKLLIQPVFISDPFSVASGSGQ